jgi:hypothetical protein
VIPTSPAATLLNWNWNDEDDDDDDDMMMI